MVIDLIRKDLRRENKLWPDEKVNGTEATLLEAESTRVPERLRAGLRAGWS